MRLRAPYAPPPVPHRRRRGGIVAPLGLIFAGGVFLLENTGYLSPGTWQSLWRVWPLLLVLAGIEQLWADRVPWIAQAGLTGLVLIIGVLVISATGFGGQWAPPLGVATSLARTDLGGATQAAITVRFAAGQLNIGPLVDAVPDELAMMSFAGPPELAPQPRYSPISGNTRLLDYQVNGRSVPSFMPLIGGSAGMLPASPTVLTSFPSMPK